MIRRQALYFFLFVACSCAKKKNEENKIPNYANCKKDSIGIIPKYLYKDCLAYRIGNDDHLEIQLIDSSDVEVMKLSIPNYFSSFRKAHNGEYVSDARLFGKIQLYLLKYYCIDCNTCKSNIEYDAVSFERIKLTDTTSFGINFNWTSRKEYMNLRVEGVKFINHSLKDTFYLDSMYVPKVSLDVALKDH